jgi:hypothetical protein
VGPRERDRILNNVSGPDRESLCTAPVYRDFGADRVRLTLADGREPVDGMSPYPIGEDPRRITAAMTAEVRAPGSV